MKQMSNRPSRLLLLSILALTPASGQDEPAAEFGGQIEVTEVLVDVLATDRHGNIVPDLGKDDFVVEEDGHGVEISSVTFYTTRYADLEGAESTPSAEPAPPDVPPSTVPASRYFILFFHDQSGGVTNESELTRKRLESARDAHRWVRDEMGPSDWIAVVRYDQTLTVHTDFSQHRGTIMAGIEQATLNEVSELMRPSARRRAAAGTSPSLLRGLPSTFDLEKLTPRVEHAVRLVAEAAGTILGRKNLILFSLGFGSIDSAFASPDARYYPPMEEALNASNVAVYPIDLAGPSVDTPQTGFLSQLADDTGGELYKTFLTFLDPLQRISAQATGYYLLSFRSEHPAGESGFREIKVKARDRKIRVKARRGYRYGDESGERKRRR